MTRAAVGSKRKRAVNDVGSPSDDDRHSDGTSTVSSTQSTHEEEVDHDEDFSGNFDDEQSDESSWFVDEEGSTSDEDPLDNTGIFLAAMEDDRDVMEALLLEAQQQQQQQQVGDILNATDSKGNTALIRAAQKNSIHCVELLIDKGADTAVRNRDGDTAVLAAAEMGQCEVLQHLLKHGASPNVLNNYGNTPLMLVEEGRMDIARCLIEHGADVNAESPHGTTALGIAAQQCPQCTTLLLKHGATITPNVVSAAVENSQLQVLEILAANGADLNGFDKMGETPLTAALMNGNSDSAEWLVVSAGADVSKLNDDGESPLSLAVDGCDTELTWLLVQKGASPNVVNATEEITPLEIAATRHGLGTTLTPSVEKRQRWAAPVISTLRHSK